MGAIHPNAAIAALMRHPGRDIVRWHLWDYFHGGVLRAPQVLGRAAWFNREVVNHPVKAFLILNWVIPLCEVADVPLVTQLTALGSLVLITVLSILTGNSTVCSAFVPRRTP